MILLKNSLMIYADSIFLKMTNNHYNKKKSAAHCAPVNFFVGRKIDVKLIDMHLIIAYHNTYVMEVRKMTTFTASEARKRLYNLVDEVKDSHVPVQIVGKRNSAVLVSEEDWRAIEETLYLATIPGMRESIKRGLKTPVEKCKEEPGW